MEHSKLPWRYQKETTISGIGDSAVGYQIYTDKGVYGHHAECEKKEDAAFIVEACNNYDRLREINGELVKALKRITNQDKKSILADCAYQGANKKWIAEMAPYYDGYNKALTEIQEISKAALQAAQRRLNNVHP